MMGTSMLAVVVLPMLTVSPALGSVTVKVSSAEIREKDSESERRDSTREAAIVVAAT